jgi:hypothetical protein
MWFLFRYLSSGKRRKGWNQTCVSWNWARLCVVLIWRKSPNVHKYFKGQVLCFSLFVWFTWPGTTLYFLITYNVYGNHSEPEFSSLSFLPMFWGCQVRDATLRKQRSLPWGRQECRVGERSWEHWASQYQWDQLFFLGHRTMIQAAEGSCLSPLMEETKMEMLKWTVWKNWS